MTTDSGDEQLERFDGVILVTLFFAAAESGAWISPAVSCRIVCALCERLHALHTAVDGALQPKNLVHGALSMDWVLVGRDGSVQLVRLPQDLEELGQKSPEQLAGRRADVRSDVFNTGLVLYILLTGNHPFVLDTDDESERANRECRIPPPSQLGPFPPELEAVVMRAVAKEPRDRYPDLPALQAALEEALRVLGISASQEDVAAVVRDTLPPDRPPPTGDGPANADELLALVRGPELRSAPPREVETYFDDGHEVKGAASPRAVAWCAQLLDLGFTRLGVKVELSFHTGALVPELSFASASKEAFGCIWFGADQVPNLYFYTAFAGGELVLTRAYALPAFRTERVAITAAPGLPLPEVLEVHRAEVQAMKSRGAVPYEKWGRDERLAATRAYYRSPETPK